MVDSSMEATDSTKRHVSTFGKTREQESECPSGSHQVSVGFVSDEMKVMSSSYQHG
jgi:hypothetical protein